MEWDWWYFQAFWDLSTCRSFGMTVGPIPHNFVKQYGRDAGLDEENLEMFVGIMRDLDSVYLTDLEEQRKQHKDAPPPTHRPDPPAAPAIRQRRVVSGAK